MNNVLLLQIRAISVSSTPHAHVYSIVKTKHLIYYFGVQFCTFPVSVM